MRARGDSLTARPAPALLAAAALLLGAAGAGCQQRAAQSPARSQSTTAAVPVAAPAAGPPAVAPGDSYYPLAVGDSWTYGCAVEGEHLFDKTVTIAARDEMDGGERYRVVQASADDSLVYYLSVDTRGWVHRSAFADGRESEVVGSQLLRAGERVGDWLPARAETIAVPALGEIGVLVLENFSAEDPALPPQKRLEWRGLFFAKGIGLVAEGDGAGAQCDLSAYRRRQ